MLHTKRPSSVRVRIVRIKGDVIVTDELAHRGQRHFITATGHEKITFEVFRGSLLKFWMFSAARKVPMLFHTLQPIRQPARVGFHMNDGKVGMSLDGPVPDEAHHGDHGFERMSDDVTGSMGFHAVAV